MSSNEPSPIWASAEIGVSVNVAARIRAHALAARFLRSCEIWFTVTNTHETTGFISYRETILLMSSRPFVPTCIYDHLVVV